jgi:hypothetical protein
MAVLKDPVQTANVLLLILKGDNPELSAELIQMLREMRVLLGDGMWDHVVVGVTFWSFSQLAIDERNRQVLLEYAVSKPCKSDF